MNEVNKVTREILVQRDLVVHLAEKVQMELQAHKDHEEDLVNLEQLEPLVHQDLLALLEQRDLQVYLVRPGTQGGMELLEPRENREPWAPQALGEGPALEGHQDHPVRKEMLAQPADVELVEEQVTRVTRALQDLWDHQVTLVKREHPEILVYLDKMGDREMREPRDDQENEDQQVQRGQREPLVLQDAQALED